MIKQLKDKTIGVFFGGCSPEHEISIITGQFVISKLKKMGYNIQAIYVNREGEWFTDVVLSELKFFKNDFDKELNKLPKFDLDLSNSKGKLILNTKKLIGKKNIVIDYIFPTFHGLRGEDGTIQGLAEFFQVPYAGCGIYSSSVSIDKIITKKLLKSLNIPTTNFLSFKKQDWEDNREKIIQNILSNLNFPLFIKPARSGSSIGISKVKDEKKLIDALELGFYYDSKIIVEDSVENISDLTCSVLSDGKKIIASEIQESLFDSDLFDYEVKYIKEGGSQIGNSDSNLQIPANLDHQLSNKIKEYSKIIFDQIEANGIIRVDFLLNKNTKDLFVNEINTLPGTLYHHLWDKSGIKIEEVIENMLEHGLARWDDSSAIRTDFISDVLNNANNMKLQIN